MEFRPLYYAEKAKLVKEGEPYDKNKLNIVNPEGMAGIVTLWSKPWEAWKTLQQRAPQLFERTSPLVILSSLYGNGLPQMLANLAYNPQIYRLAITGNDTKVVPSFTYLMNFLEKGVEVPSNEWQLGRIKETQFPIDPKLKPEMFRYLQVQRFKPDNLEGLINFIGETQARQVSESDRIQIKLMEPEFKDFPSDITNHVVDAETPLKAWMDVIYSINRFGQNVQLAKGIRRTLYNLEVHIDNPKPEEPELLKKFGFDPEELNEYRKNIITPDLPSGVTYNYGNRMRQYFGVDSLEKVIERLNKDPADRRGFISLWDNKSDIVSPIESDSSVPCLTDLYFVKNDEKLMLTASFRTHSAVSAWLLNLYGLRSVQEYVSERTGIATGKINVKSRYIGIDPNDGRTNSALDIVNRERRIKENVHDPRGYFVIGLQDQNIVAEHYSPDGNKLKTYKGDTADAIKDQLRHDSAVSNADHANWIGIQLGALHYKLHNEVPE